MQVTACMPPAKNDDRPLPVFFLQIWPSSHPAPSFMKSHSSTSSKQYFGTFLPVRSPQMPASALICRGKQDSSSVQSASTWHVLSGSGRHIQYAPTTDMPRNPFVLTFSSFSLQVQLSVCLLASLSTPYLYALHDVALVAPVLPPPSLLPSVGRAVVV